MPPIAGETSCLSRNRHRHLRQRNTISSTARPCRRARPLATDADGQGRCPHRADRRRLGSRLVDARASDPQPCLRRGRDATARPPSRRPARRTGTALERTLRLVAAFACFVQKQPLSGKLRPSRLSATSRTTSAAWRMSVRRFRLRQLGRQLLDDSLFECANESESIVVACLREETAHAPQVLKLLASLHISPYRLGMCLDASPARGFTQLVHSSGEQLQQRAPAGVAPPRSVGRTGCRAAPARSEPATGRRP